VALTEKLLELAAMVESADGPNLDLGRSIYWAVGRVPLLSLDDPTQSIDAAAKLVPEGMIFVITNCGVANRTNPDMLRSTAMVSAADCKLRPCPTGEAANPALALTAAALRAIAWSKERTGQSSTDN
jgi:hypothetical protein